MRRAASRGVLVAFLTLLSPAWVEAGNTTAGTQPPRISNVNAPVPSSVRAEAPRNVNLRLWGTVLHANGKGIAIIEEVATGEQKGYHVGDRVNDGRLVQILRDRVILAFTGGQFELLLNAGVGGGAEELSEPIDTGQDDHFGEVDSEALDRFSSDPDLLTRVTPAGDEGIKIGKFETKGVLDTLGLRPGDVIRNVNGQVPVDGETLKNEVAKLAAVGEGMLRVEIMRQGRMQVRYFRVVP